MGMLVSVTEVEAAWYQNGSGSVADPTGGRVGFWDMDAPLWMGLCPSVPSYSTFQMYTNTQSSIGRLFYRAKIMRMNIVMKT